MRENHERKNIAIIGDYGMDDAIATIFILLHADHFNRIDFVPVGGNFPLENTKKNIIKLLRYYDDGFAPMTVVDTSGIAQPCEKLADIHGSDGMGGILDDRNESGYEMTSYEQWLEEINDNYILLSLGPCTVTLDILRKKGPLPLVMMAGNISQPPNFNGYEFNHALDKEAFAECVKYPHVCATLDTCHNPRCDLFKIDFPTDGVYAPFLKRYYELSKERGEDACYIYDLIAAIYTVFPERFETEKSADKDGNEINVLKYVSKLNFFERTNIYVQ